MKNGDTWTVIQKSSPTVRQIGHITGVNYARALCESVLGTYSRVEATYFITRLVAVSKRRRRESKVRMGYAVDAPAWRGRESMILKTIGIKMSNSRKVVQILNAQSEGTVQWMELRAGCQKACWNSNRESVITERNKLFRM